MEEDEDEELGPFIAKHHQSHHHPKHHSHGPRHIDGFHPHGLELTTPLSHHKRHRHTGRMYNDVFYKYPSFDDGFSIETGAQSSWCTCNLGLGTLPSLVFIGFMIYAISVSNTDATTKACGGELWEYMFVRLILMCVQFFVIGCVVGCFSICLNSQSAAAVLGVIMFLAYFSTLLGIGVPIVTGALASSPCVSALSATSFTNTPILAILGAVLIGSDALALFLFFCGICIGVGFFMVADDTK